MRATVPLLIASALLGAACSREGSTSPTTVPVPAIEPLDCGVSDPPREIPRIDPPEVIPPALVVEELRPGMGPAASDGDTLFIDFIGIRSEDGFVIDSSYDREIPLDFVLGRGGVIPGWDAGLVGARTGSMYRLDVPGDLAYGDNPPGETIRPGDALSFVVEVRAVVPASTAADAPLDLDVDPSIGATEVTTQDLVAGEGEIIEIGDTAIVHALLVRGDNEIVLLNSWERVQPFLIDVEVGSSAMAGFVQGLQCARVGATRVITVPPAWAFGPGGEASLGLPPDTDLIIVAQIMGAY